MSFKNKGEASTFSDIEKLKEDIACQLPVQEMLQEVFLAYKKCNR